MSNISSWFSSGPRDSERRMQVQMKLLSHKGGSKVDDSQEKAFPQSLLRRIPCEGKGGLYRKLGESKLGEAFRIDSQGRGGDDIRSHHP